MPLHTVYAKAKINITLDVTAKRPDGYHNLKMIMQTVGLSDKITIDTDARPGISVRTNLRYLPNDHRNIAYGAAKLFFEKTGILNRGLALDIEKSIPVCAGLAGGSSDAAAVLTSLNDIFAAGLSQNELMELGLILGSDVPYCILGGCALAEGRGEILTPLPSLPKCRVVICKPPFTASTASVFQKLDCAKIIYRPDTDGALKAVSDGDLRGVCIRMYNVFEDLSERIGEIKDIKKRLIDNGALGACMSGTGPSVFGIFNGGGADSAFEALKSKYSNTFLTEII